MTRPLILAALLGLALSANGQCISGFYICASSDPQWCIDQAKKCSAFPTPVDYATYVYDDQQLDSITANLNTAAALMDPWAVKKWCHTNPWRWLRGYREPQWCGGSR